MIVNCFWEHNGDDTLLYAVDHIGAYTRGESLEVAASKMRGEILSYLKWTGADAIFESEKEPLSAEEYERLKALALKSAEDFLYLYRSIPDKSATA